MASIDRNLQFRGNPTRVLGLGGTLVFTTLHSEGQPTALYRVQPDKGELGADALPCGGLDLLLVGERLLVLGSDGALYAAPAAGGPAAKVGGPYSPAPIAMAALQGGRLALVGGQKVLIVRQADGGILQELDLAEPASAVAADPSGVFFVVGTERGMLAVFDCEEKDRFLGAESATVHQGPVTALLFEPGELRVLSGGADKRLFTTHVRGRLEPEDRGGGANHEQPIRALALGPESHGAERRFYSVGDDGNLKAWPLGAGRKRPNTTRDGVARAVSMDFVLHKERPHLAMALHGGGLRLFIVDPAGKVGEAVQTWRGALDWAKAELGQSDARRREAALEALAAWNDGPAIEQLAATAKGDADHGVRAQATKLLAESGNSRARKPLKELLGSDTPAVRLRALEGLRRLDGPTALEPLDAAIAARKPDLGKEAVRALAQLAKADDLAMERLLQAMNADPAEVRAEALAVLEGMTPASSPEASLKGLRSTKGDLRRLALIRLYQRGLAALPEVSTALRRHGEDPDADVRLTAFLVGVSARPLLAEALRGRDRDLARQLFELETWGKPDDPDRKPPKARKVARAELSDADLRPLLEAMASRAQDTCLRGATGLAALQDARALGALLLLSREAEAPARVAACRALETLGDPRALNRLRLMIRDGAAEVRDAAFSALSRLEEGALTPAEAGLAAEHEDVRRRGLQTLLARLRAGLKGAEQERAQELLRRALNDAAAPVRTEAFKAVLNLNIGGGGAQSLRFALSSLHADVRREVLTEAMARIAESWAWPLLLELFDDPEEVLRREAFEFATKKTRGRKLEPLAAGLRSRYPDQRQRAAQELAQKRNAEAQDLLVQALEDAEPKVRGLAIQALVAAEAHEALTRALGSAHPDVRAAAACARAVHGDPAALEPLLALAREPRPEAGKGDAGAWERRVIQAAEGLGALGAVAALEPLAALLDRPEAGIRAAAAVALAWTSRPDQADALRAGLRHTDEAVRLQCALGLAFNGDPAGLSLITAQPAPAQKGRNATKGPSLPESAQLQAAVALGEHGTPNLLRLLDSPSDPIRRQATLAVLLLDLAEGGDPPPRLLSALSADTPDVRLAAAEALDVFPDAAAYEREVLSRLNLRPEGQLNWKLEVDVVRGLAGLLGSPDPQLRARAGIQLAALDHAEQEGFDRAWRALTERLGAPVVQSAAAAAQARAAAAPRSDGVELQGMVVGAYVGLSRKGTPRQLSLRTQALSRLIRKAEADAGHAPTAQAALLLALNDSVQAVRQFAFEGLKRLGLSTAELGGEALASPHRDVGTLGLSLLAEDAGGEGGVGLLRRVVEERTDGLQTAALELYTKRAGEVEAGLAALEARDPGTTEAGVTLLARVYADPRAQAGLRAALRSRHPGPRLSAALRLAEHKDPEAFEGLLPHLRSDDSRAQSAAITALVGLNEPRVPDALMDRVQQDPAGTARIDELLGAVGSLRGPGAFTRLLSFAADKRTRQAALKAALRVTGYDQSVEEPDEDSPGEWVQRQHPRRHALFAELLRVAMDQGEDRFVRSQLRGARWCPEPVVDAPLARFTTAVEPRLRNEALEAVGWRLRKRQGPADPLLRALEAPDAEVRFLAAEGLALAARSEGVAVLLAAVELMPELDYRRRAVEALGPLADTRALDLLLRLATEQDHALQEPAAEAIGHMGRSPRAEEVLKALLRLAEADSGVGCRAITGLRHLGTEPAWVAVRARAGSEDWRIRQAVAEALGHDPSQAAQDTLFKLVNDPDSDVSGAAVDALRLRLGPDSAEPDLAQARSEHGPADEAPLRRIRAKASAAQLFTALAEVREGMQDEWFEPLAAILLSRQPLAVDEAAAALPSPKDRVVEVAARLLAQAGPGAAAHAAAVSQAAHRALDQLLQGSEDRRHGRESDLAGRVEALGGVARALLRASGRLGGDATPALRAAALVDVGHLTLRRAALLALAEGLGGAAGLQALQEAATGSDAEARALAASALRALDPERAAALVGQSLDDPSSLARLLRGGGAELAALRAGASRAERLGAVLPHLVLRRDVEGLAAVLADRQLPDGVRLGAAEGLGRIPDRAVDEALLLVARKADEDEDIRKAAWKALRRARRLRTPNAEEVRG